MVQVAEKKGKNFSGAVSVASMVEDVIGCKWTLHILEQIRTGVQRPGAIVRSHPGLTTKVLNERLRKLVRFGIVKRNSFPEIPPRVEYELTEIGRRLIPILDSVQDLQRQLERPGQRR